MYLDFKHSYHSDDLSVLCSHLRQLSFCPTGGNSLSLSFRTDERLSKELRGWGMTMLCRCSFPPGRTQRRQIRLYWWFIRVVCVSREPHVLIFFSFFFCITECKRFLTADKIIHKIMNALFFFVFGGSRDMQTTVLHGCLIYVAVRIMIFYWIKITIRNRHTEL